MDGENLQKYENIYMIFKFPEFARNHYQEESASKVQTMASMKQCIRKNVQKRREREKRGEASHR